MLLCCGLTTLDLIQTVERLPGPDEKLQASSATLEVGGPAANAAMTAALLGASVRLVTALGAGPLAASASAELTAIGVDVVDALPAGTAWQPPVSSVLVVAGSGQRSVVSGNALGAAPLGWEASVMDGVTAVLVDGHHAALALPAVIAGREAGLPVLLDGGSWKDVTPQLLPYVEVAVLSSDFLVPGVAASNTLGAVAAYGPRVVAVTRGAEPILVLEAGAAVLEIDVPVVADVVDTVGAGDVLHGALGAMLAGALEGGASMADRLGVAAQFASRSCWFAGARGWAVDA